VTTPLDEPEELEPEPDEEEAVVVAWAVADLVPVAAWDVEVWAADVDVDDDLATQRLFFLPGEIRFLSLPALLTDRSLRVASRCACERWLCLMGTPRTSTLPACRWNSVGFERTVQERARTERRAKGRIA